MALQVQEIGPNDWGRYKQISTTFRVERAFDCKPVDGGLGGILLQERPVEPPYEKTEFDPDDIPVNWAKEHDLKTWGVFLATDGARPVGAAAVAPPSPHMVGVERRSDAAFLASIHVSADSRRQGVGKALLRCCAEWAKARGFRFLVIETQNVNVPACRFYAACGAELAEIRRFAYRHCHEAAKETMLIWQLTL